ncbi:hypothetical protein [Virgibacillus halotolerans]|uniref:hypothetical protein n=1 Tax=Virgibacillus halotolerans TaxID=1071053 RepID=UPI0019609234|nr:hypothetical protein [Virgibacillus halotolerans]
MSYEYIVSFNTDFGEVRAVIENDEPIEDDNTLYMIALNKIKESSVMQITGELDESDIMEI